jgi:quinoprotein glucose dehydrogenase
MGGALVAAGGSPAYALIGLGVLITAVLLFLRKKSALTLYALLMWAILIWIIYEAGFDKWQWIPRGDLFALLGFWLALPWVVRRLYIAQTPAESRSFHPFLGGTVAVMIVIVVGIMFYDPYPVQGEITNPVSAKGASGAAEDWVAYGGTNDGQRSPHLIKSMRGMSRNSRSPGSTTPATCVIRRRTPANTPLKPLR